MVGTGELPGQSTAPETAPVQGAWGGTGSRQAPIQLATAPEPPYQQFLTLLSPRVSVFLPLALAQGSRTGPVPQPYFDLICLSVLKDHPSVFSPY